MRSFMKAVFSLTLACFTAGACANTLEAGVDDVAAQPSTGPSFTNADAAAEDATEARDTFTSYCPSNKCPAGYTTCPNSDFPCDVNLLADRQNCGACGVVCPESQETPSRERYECVEGRCVLMCSRNPKTMDCDGLPDNGCEASAAWDTSCGACGVVCSDPAKPCMHQGGDVATDYACGCKDGLQLCQGRCVDMKDDDLHCGACRNVCPKTGDGGPLDPELHLYYGCVDEVCGRRKCEPTWSDCDGNPHNGCEASMLSNDNCGACGNACSAGQRCQKDVYGGIQCMCPDGQSYCSRGTSAGSCHDFDSDPDNCGGCNFTCRRFDFYTSVGVCVKGVCKLECLTGQADCNGNQSDGCEVNVSSDPRNCGGCGIVCDAIAGQACVQGRCVVEPCAPDEDAGRGPQ